MLLVGSEEGESQVKTVKQMEQAIQESELNQLKSGKLRLRKSLDWDRDFFTSEGMDFVIPRLPYVELEFISLPDLISYSQEF